ncbi:unnamed protein product [Coccothraustes coccothraustes]
MNPHGLAPPPPPARPPCRAGPGAGPAHLLAERGGVGEGGRGLAPAGRAPERPRLLAAVARARPPTLPAAARFLPRPPRPSSGRSPGRAQRGDEHGAVPGQLALRLLAERDGGAHLRLLHHHRLQGAQCARPHRRLPGHAKKCRRFHWT